MKKDNIPSAPEIEENILGALMIDKKAMDKVSQLIAPSIFCNNFNGLVFKAMLKIFEDGKTTDIYTVHEYLKQSGGSREIGGMDYLTKLSQSISTSALIVEHCKIVIEKWMLRSLLALGKNLVEKSTTDVEPFELIKEITEKIYEIENHIEGYEPDKNLREHIPALIEKVEKKYSENIGEGLKSYSFPSLNNATGGLMPTDYIIIYGLDKSGKTTIAHRLLLDFAFQDKKVAVFSLEMDFEQIGYKDLAMEVGFEYLKLRNPKGQNLTSEEFKEFVRQIEKFQKTNIFIDDKTFDFEKIISKSKLWKRKYGIDVFCYDYVGLIESNIKTESIKYLVKYYSRRFKQLAKELETPIILVSQANEHEKTADSIDLLRDCDFAIRLSKPIEVGIRSIKSDGREFIFNDTHFLATVERSRHGKNKQNFVCGYQNNKFVEIGIGNEYRREYPELEEQII